MKESLVLPEAITHRRESSTTMELHIATISNTRKTLNAVLVIRTGDPSSPLNPPGTCKAAANVIVVISAAITDKDPADSLISALRIP